MKKKFVIYWNETYQKEQAKIVGADQFTSEFGFDRGDQLRVNKLDVGETMPVDDCNIWIMRVK